MASSFFLTASLLALLHIFGTNHAKIQTPKARKMLPAENGAKRTLRTEYFDPKTYTSQDFPRMIVGFGQQIKNDLDKAHSELVAHSEQVQQLRDRLELLEKLLERRHALDAFLLTEPGIMWPKGLKFKYLLVIALALFLSLLALLAFVILAKCCVGLKISVAKLLGCTQNMSSTLLNTDDECIGQEIV